MREVLSIMKALADENRLRIVAALRGRELCLCQIVELLGLANSTVSRHMSLLYQSRIVESRKDGRWSYFRLTTETEHPKAAEAAALVIRSLEQDSKVRGDKKLLKRILKMDPEEVCRKQSTCKC